MSASDSVSSVSTVDSFVPIALAALLANLFFGILLVIVHNFLVNSSAPWTQKGCAIGVFLVQTVATLTLTICAVEVLANRWGDATYLILKFRVEFTISFLLSLLIQNYGQLFLLQRAWRFLRHTNLSRSKSIIIVVSTVAIVILSINSMAIAALAMETTSNVRSRSHSLVLTYIWLCGSLLISLALTLTLIVQLYIQNKQNLLIPKSTTFTLQNFPKIFDRCLVFFVSSGGLVVILHAWFLLGYAIQMSTDTTTVPTWSALPSFIMSNVYTITYVVILSNNPDCPPSRKSLEICPNLMHSQQASIINSGHNLTNLPIHPGGGDLNFQKAPFLDLDETPTIRSPITLSLRGRTPEFDENTKSHQKFPSIAELHRMSATNAFSPTKIRHMSIVESKPSNGSLSSSMASSSISSTKKSSRPRTAPERIEEVVGENHNLQRSRSSNGR